MNKQVYGMIRCKIIFGTFIVESYLGIRIICYWEARFDIKWVNDHIRILTILCYSFEVFVIAFLIYMQSQNLKENKNNVDRASIIE